MVFFFAAILFTASTFKILLCWKSTYSFSLYWNIRKTCLHFLGIYQQLVESLLKHWNHIHSNFDAKRQQIAKYLPKITYIDINMIKKIKFKYKNTISCSNTQKHIFTFNIHSLTLFLHIHIFRALQVRKSNIDKVFRSVCSLSHNLVLVF